MFGRGVALLGATAGFSVGEYGKSGSALGEMNQFISPKSPFKRRHEL